MSLSSTKGCEGEWSAFDPLPKLTQASDKDVRIIVGKERESYEPELNYRMWDIALRNGTLDRNAGRNVERSADVTGSGRHFCDGELNFKKALLDEAFFFYTIK